MMFNIEIGKKYNKLTVLEFSCTKIRKVKNENRKEHYYKCQCDCGKIKDIVSWRITGGYTQSCGCMRNYSKKGIKKEKKFYKQNNKKYLYDLYYKEGQKYTLQKDKKAYTVWMAILSKCYRNNKFCYKNVEICEEWWDFQNFAKWYYNNYYQLGNESMDINKNILVKNNKIYGPKFCMFVPQSLTTLLNNRKQNRGNTPIGMSKFIYKRKIHEGESIWYSVRFRKKNKMTSFGSYYDPETAFQVYKTEKEKYIKEVADEYAKKYSQFPKKLYDALYRYKIEMED